MDWHPSDWVVLSRSLRRRYIDRTIRLGGEAAQGFIDMLFKDIPPGGIWVRPFEIQTRAGPFVVAWYGFSEAFKMAFCDYREGEL